MESTSRISHLWGGLRKIIAICFSGENRAKEISPASNSNATVRPSEPASVSPKKEAHAWRAARTATPILTDDILEQLNYAEWVDVQIRGRVVSVPKVWIGLYKEQRPKKLELQLPEQVDITTPQEAADFLNSILSVSQNHTPRRVSNTDTTRDMAKPIPAADPTDELFAPINRYIRDVSQEYTMPLPIQLLGHDKEPGPAASGIEDPDRRRASVRVRRFSAQIRQSYLSEADAAYGNKYAQSTSDESIVQLHRFSNGSTGRALIIKPMDGQDEAQEDYMLVASEPPKSELPQHRGDDTAIQHQISSEESLVPATESVAQHNQSLIQQEAVKYPEIAAEPDTFLPSLENESVLVTVEDDSASPKTIYPKTPFRINFFPANEELENGENDGQDTPSHYTTSPDTSPPPSPSPQRRASAARSAHISTSPIATSSSYTALVVQEQDVNTNTHNTPPSETSESGSTHRRNNSNETNVTGGSSLLAASYATPATTAAAESPAPTLEPPSTELKAPDSKKRNIASRFLDVVQGRDVVHLNVNDSHALKIPDIHGTRAHELAALQSLSRVTAVASQAPKKGAIKPSSPKPTPTDSRASEPIEEEPKQTIDQPETTKDSAMKELPTDASDSPSALSRISAAFRRMSRANSVRSLRSSARNSLRSSSRRASAIELGSSPDNDAKRSSAPIREDDESYSGPWWTRLHAVSAPSGPLPPTPADDGIGNGDVSNNEPTVDFNTPTHNLFTLPSPNLLRTPVKDFLDNVSLDGDASTPGFARSTVASRNKAKIHKEIEISMTPASRPGSRATTPGPVPESPTKIGTPALDIPIKIRTPVRSGQTMWPVGTPQLVRKYRQPPGNVVPPKSPTAVPAARSPNMDRKQTNDPFL